MRTRAQIKQDIDVAATTIQQLHDEFDRTPERDLTIRSFHRNVREPLTFNVRWGRLSITSDSPMNNSFDAAAACTLRDFLNANFPASA